jgi:general secretion pathway protein G
MRALSESKRPLWKIAILVVTGYLFFFYFATRPARYGGLARGKPEIAKIQIKELEGALRLYSYDAGKYPSTQEGLLSLIHDPGASQRWRGPYLQRGEIPNDPWGRPYLYRCPGAHDDFDLFSYGADGAEGGNGEAADITNWKGIDTGK